MNSFESLSEKQQEIVFDKAGKFVVRACPGSGKTYSVAARFARLLHEWKQDHQGIATISFTNVAWQEIDKYLAEYFNIYTPIRYPHFLGTIDSFINKYIFLPFGHLVLECENRPTLVGEPHGTWSSGYYDRDYHKYFDKATLDITGELVPSVSDLTAFHFSWKRNKNGSINGHVKNLLEVKQKYWEEGFATQADANYFSLQLLRSFPELASSLSAKFPYMIIDEAQDTNSIQMEILNCLISNGLDQIMIVGDPDQAIFEWNEARPDLFEEKFKEWEDNSVILNENRRSTQRICNTTFSLSTLDEPSNSVNTELTEVDNLPKFITYSEANLSQTVDTFLEECTDKGIEVSHENVAVLCRSQSFVNNILGLNNRPSNKSPWKTGKLRVKQFAFGKYLIDNENFNEGYKLIEKGTVSHRLKLKYCSKETINEIVQKKGFVPFRTYIQKVIQCLPKTSNMRLVDWIHLANEQLGNQGFNIPLEINERNGNVDFDTLFKSTKENKLSLNYGLGTVHSVKGQTFDAVLVFLKKKGLGRFYKTLLREGLKTCDDEELRIVYVALTRPRKVLMLALPDNDNLRAWQSRLIDN